MSTAHDLNLPPSLRAATLCLLAAVSMNSQAAQLVVRISGLAAPWGQVGCVLFAGPTGFPMDNSAARVVWQPVEANAASQGMVCRFADVKEGSYAVSIGHDVNGNKKVDTNLVGLPTEQWGVSNNIRPGLRAPRFDEAAFKVPADAKEVALDIWVAK